MTNIQTFTFSKDSTIIGLWDKLKDYRYKLRVVDTNTKTTYNNTIEKLGSSVQTQRYGLATLRVVE
jgi:hypothetical protein